MKMLKYIIIYLLTPVLVSNCTPNNLETKEEKTAKETNLEVAKQTVVNADFQLFELDGRLVKMENYNGKPYIITLWNTKDKKSIDNLKQLAITKDKYGDRINIFALSEEHVSKIIQFKNEAKLPLLFYKIASTKNKRKKALNFLYNKQGNLVKEISPDSYTTIENQLNE